MRKKKNKIRFYIFKNLTEGMYGQTFGMCDEHKKNYTVPFNCVMEKLLETVKMSCSLCDMEEEWTENHRKQ